MFKDGIKKMRHGSWEILPYYWYSSFCIFPPLDQPDHILHRHLRRLQHVFILYPTLHPILNWFMTLHPAFWSIWCPDFMCFFPRPLPRVSRTYFMDGSFLNPFWIFLLSPPSDQSDHVLHRRIQRVRFQRTRRPWLTISGRWQRIVEARNTCC